MKKQQFTVLGAMLLVFAMAITTTGCDVFLDKVKGSGNIVSEERNVKSFNEIQVGSNFEVFLQESDKPGLVIEADDNLISFIDTEVRGKTLRISAAANFQTQQRPRVYIAYSSLKALKLSGAAKLRSDETLQAKNLDLSLSGASVIFLDVLVDDIEVRASGASKVHLTGVAEELSVRLSGASRLYADELEAEDANMRLSGSSKAEVWVSDEISARTSGASHVLYSGSPSSISIKTSGASSVKKR